MFQQFKAHIYCLSKSNTNILTGIYVGYQLGCRYDFKIYKFDVFIL